MKKIAYLILAHSDPSHFGKLCNALKNEYSDIYAHIDKKSNSFNAFKEAASGNDVHFLTNRISVSWGGISIVDAVNELILEALKNKEQYSHFLLISGSCYPIKKVDYIYNLITKNHRKEHIKLIDMRESPEHYIKHINRKWYYEPIISRGNSKILQFIDKAIRKLLTMLKMPNQWNDDIVPYWGSMWFALTPDCCEYIIEFQENNPSFRLMNTNTLAPDEHFYHTIIGNSKYYKYSLGKQKYEGRGLFRYANLHIIHPALGKKWYTIDDWDEIISSDKLFVRKVRSIDGSSLVERINNDILAK